MTGTHPQWSLDRLPDGSVRRRDERAAAATVAADLLLAAATQAAEKLTAAQLGELQRQGARDLADRYKAAALDVVANAQATAELARDELAAAEVAAAALLQAGQQAALGEIAAAEAAAAADLAAFEARLRATEDFASSRALAAAELADARQSATLALADARRRADVELAAAVRLAARQVAAADKSARAAQASELAALYAEAAEELVGAQAEAARELAAAHAHAAADLAAAAHAAAEELAGVRDEAAKELAKAEEQFRLVMDWAGVAGCTVSNEGRFLRVNRAMCELLDRSEDELLRTGLADVTHPDDIEVLDALVDDLVAGQRSSFRTLTRTLGPDGRIIWGDLSVAAVLNYDRTAAFHVAQIVDVTARVDYEAVLASMTTRDTLTGLASRAALLAEVDRALSAQGRSGRGTAVLVADLDHFKNVNESLGHTSGDEMLRAAAVRMESVVRGGDLVARLGGDEFVLVMRDLDDPADAVRAAWRLVEAFRRPFTASGTEFYLTVSIGVATASGQGAFEREHASGPERTFARADDGEAGITAGDMLREADTAMYQAKAAGRDRIAVYDEELRARVANRLAVESDLRHALERGQFAVWYQPEINLATGAVIAVEALLRWHHPDGSVWTADRFIDVAEDTGLILDIGDWVLRTACAQGAAWATARPDRPIIMRVNKSAHQVAGARLLSILDDALATSGLDPGLLCIEITETALLRQTATAAANLAGVHERGVAIAIDDFGTGYASLLYMRRYPVDVIKIDRSFVTDITTVKGDRAVAAAVITLAGALGMSVTAEGVEHPEQAAVLRDLGCPGAQGWLYSKAVPPDEATALLDHVYPHG
ncbi:MAG TPA: bifunctional diguanylate cyclase/phosphodiesterase [Motilibacterales bacterium]|nr:bifunctional diguanylate cyclase/phosphodiesterase [Motilibacterales bacterium]